MMVITSVAAFLFILASVGSLKVNDPVQRLGAISIASGLGTFLFLLVSGLQSGQWLKTIFIFSIICVGSALGSHVIARTLVFKRKVSLKQQGTDTLEYYLTQVRHQKQNTLNKE